MNQLAKQYMDAEQLIHLARNSEAEPFLVDKMIDAGSIGAIIGGPKSRKSMLALNLALACVSGSPFLGQTVASEQRVLFVNLELRPRALGSRLNAMNEYYNCNSIQLKRLHIIRQDEFIGNDVLVDPLTRKIAPKPFDILINRVLNHNINLVVIDPLYYVVGEENDNMLMTALLREFDRVRTNTNTAIAFVHHTRKGGTDWNDLFHCARGASSFGGFLDWAIGMEVEGAHMSLHHGARNFRSMEVLHAKFDETPLVWLPAAASAFDEFCSKVMGSNDEMKLVDIVNSALMHGFAWGQEEIEGHLTRSRRFQRVPGGPGKPVKVRRWP